MSYELRQDESLSKSLERICCKQIEAAIGIANGCDGQDETSPVHETRKHLKKARAALRLVADAIDESCFSQQDSALKKAARLVSELRDAEVRLQTVKQLQHARGLDRRHHEIEATLTTELQTFIAAFAEWQREAVPLLQKAHELVSRWQLTRYGCEELRRAVQRSYKRARNALAEAHANPSPEKFHRFRSRAKVLWYQLRIVRPINCLVLSNFGRDLDAVGELLGRAHDLNSLQSRLRIGGGKAEWELEAEQLLPLTKAGEDELERTAATLAEHFFAERPREFGARVEEWTREWMDNSSRTVVRALVT